MLSTAFFPSVFGLGIASTYWKQAGLVEAARQPVFQDCRMVMTWMIVPVLFVIMVGGSFIKSIISGSVAKTTEATARGYSIFYMMVIWSFTGKTVVDPHGMLSVEQAYLYQLLFSAAMTVLALLACHLIYKSAHTAGEGKSMREIGQGFLRIITNWRF